MSDTPVDVEDNPGPGEGRMRGPSIQGAQPGRTAGHRAVTSAYRGVCWHRKSRRWQSAINISGKHIYLGSFDTEEEAARMFDKVAIRIRGSKAKLNFPSQDYLDPDDVLTPEPQLERLVAEARKALLEKQRCQERDAQEQREQFAAETKRRRLLAGADATARLANGLDAYIGPRGLIPPGLEMGLGNIRPGWGGTDLSGIGALHSHLPGADMAAAFAGRSGAVGGGGGPGGGVWVVQQQQEEEVRQARLRCLQRQQAGWRDSGDGGGSGNIYGDDHEPPAGNGQQPYCGGPILLPADPATVSLRRHHIIPLQCATGAATLLGPCSLSSRVVGAASGLLSAPGLMQVQTIVQPPLGRGRLSDSGERSEWASGRIPVGGTGVQFAPGAFACQRDGPLPAGAGFRAHAESAGAMPFTQPGGGVGNNNSGGGGDVHGEVGSRGLLALIARFLTGVAGELPRGCSVESLIPCSDPYLLGYTYTKGLSGQGRAERDGEGGDSEGARAMDAAAADKRVLTSQPLRGSADGSGGSGGGAGIYFRGMYRDLGFYSTTGDAMQACKACMAVLLDCRHMLTAEKGASAEATAPQPIRHKQAALATPSSQPNVDILAGATAAAESAWGSSALPLDRDQSLPAAAAKVLHDAAVSGPQPPHRMAPQGRLLRSPEQKTPSTAAHNGQDTEPSATWYHPQPTTTTTTTTAGAAAAIMTHGLRLYQERPLDIPTGAANPGAQEPAWRAALSVGVNESAASRGRESGAPREGGSRFGDTEQPPGCRTDQIGGPQGAGGMHARSPPQPSQTSATALPSSGVAVESTTQMLQVLLQLLGVAPRAELQQDQQREEQTRHEVRQAEHHAEEGQDEDVAAAGRCGSPSPELLWRGVPVLRGVPVHFGSCVGAVSESRQSGGVFYEVIPAATHLCSQETNATNDAGGGSKQDGWRVEHDFPRALATLMQLQGYAADGKVDSVGRAGYGAAGGRGDRGDRDSRQLASKGSSDSTADTVGGRCRQEC